MLPELSGLGTLTPSVPLRDESQGPLLPQEAAGEMGLFTGKPLTPLPLGSAIRRDPPARGWEGEGCLAYSAAAPSCLGSRLSDAAGVGMP